MVSVYNDTSVVITFYELAALLGIYSVVASLMLWWCCCRSRRRGASELTRTHDKVVAVHEEVVNIRETLARQMNFYPAYALKRATETASKKE